MLRLCILLNIGVCVRFYAHANLQYPLSASFWADYAAKVPLSFNEMHADTVT